MFQSDYEVLIIPNALLIIQQLESSTIWVTVDLRFIKNTTKSKLRQKESP